MYLHYKTIGFLATTILFVASCTRPNKDDDFPVGDPPPVAGGFTNSTQIAAGNLVAHFTFDGTINDAKGAITGGTANGATSFVQGRKGQAYKGSETGFLAYTNPGPVATLGSFTTTMWVNTQKHDGGAQSVFYLSKQTTPPSFWGNFFMLVEGKPPTASDNRMFMKLHFQKNTVPFIEHWIEPANDFRPDDMYGGWRHIAWTYDAATSKVGWYINGEARLLPPNAADRKASPAGDPLGALNFKDATRFLIGGWQNHLGVPFNGLEPWMLNYTGALDEFRIYNRALSGEEISALVVLERQGR